MNREHQIRVVQAALGVEIDGRIGPQTRAAFDALAAPAAPAPAEGQIIRGSAGWKFSARVDGDDLVVENVRATCFGGRNDPQDSGATASGLSTLDPSVVGVALPMNGLHFSGLSAAEHKALDGSPIPRIPWKTAILVSCDGRHVDFPVIDLGPAKRTGNAIDLTVAAARYFRPKATATNFAAMVTYRIRGGAKFLRP